LAYHRNNPYAFDPEPSPSLTKGKRGSKLKSKAKGAALDDEEANALVKSEPGVKSEPRFYGYDGMNNATDGMSMQGGMIDGLDMGGMLGLGVPLENDERPLMELARERAATAIVDQIASPLVITQVAERDQGLSVMGEGLVGNNVQQELAYMPPPTHEQEQTPYAQDQEQARDLL
jgi:hypothetical protein